MITKFLDFPPSYSVLLEEKHNISESGCFHRQVKLCVGTCHSVQLLSRSVVLSIGPQLIKCRHTVSPEDDSSSIIRNVIILWNTGHWAKYRDQMILSDTMVRTRSDCQNW
jgi:hypothetical protein